MTMSAAKALVRDEPDAAVELLDNTRRLSQDCLQETRGILYRLRSLKGGQDVGVRALGRLVSSFSRATGISAEFHHGNVPWTFGERVDAVIYRLVQEGLTNAFRHGKADRIRVMLWLAGGELRLSVWDNGRGAQTIDQGIGLSGMRERLESLGGRLNPHNTVDGFELSVVIPLPREVEA
jgi:signal transduction histidine kinase